MRSIPVARLFLILLGMTFLLVVVFSIRLTYQFGGFTREASLLAQNLQDTSTLNLDLHNKLNEQVNLVYQQLEHVDPYFVDRFSQINFELGEKQTRYLKLNIGTQERLTVENIKSLQSELSVQANQIHNQLENGNRAQAVLRLRNMQDLENKINNKFSELNDLETNKLRGVQTQLNETVTTARRAIFGLAAFLLSSLFVFTVLLRRRVLQPLGLILKATNQVREGDFSARATVERHDELGQLARSFNFMAASLAESYASLESKVEERTRQLQDMQQQLVQAAKMSAVGRMLSGVAHELNNPLTVIMGHTELAKRRMIVSGADTKEIELMETLYEQGDRCRKIVANLLQFARQEKPRLEKVKLNDVVEQALQLREYELTTRNIKLVREYDPADPICCADPNKIVQVVLNLLNNGHDAIRDTEGPGTIWVRTASDQWTVRLEVLDSGTGLHEPERVFDPFYTTKEVGQGTGLGLSVCYGIIEEHGGSIRAENWEHGACFTITMPVGDPTVLQSVRPEQVEVVPVPRKLRALVVDDEELLLKLQSSFLDDMGVQTVTAISGEDAITQIQRQQIDLIISDVRMPGAVDGIRLFEWVSRNRPELVNRFLFVSGDMIGMEVSEFFLNSTVPRIQKPFEWDDYARLVRQILGEGSESR